MASLRALIGSLEQEGQLRVIDREVDACLEMPRIISALREEPVLFKRVLGSAFPVAAGLCASRHYMAVGMGINTGDLLTELYRALCHPVEPERMKSGPAQEVVSDAVDLSLLPVNTHFREDGGAYITAGVAVVCDPDLGRNVSYHRLQRLDCRRFVARIVEGRGTDTAWRKTKNDLPMAICIGCSMPVLVTAAMSPAPGVDELAIANALSPTPVVSCVTLDLEVPVDCEIVLEGRLTHELVEEGPFVDLTETRDIVRRQPVFEVDCVTHRSDAIYQTLLPGGQEHKLLMGLPREPTIYDAVSRVCHCMDVALTRGGGHWLHAVVRIRKERADDGRQAIAAAFQGHSSLKHVVIVDDDVDIHDLREVEWAIATRFQADRDLLLLRNQPGSSLDPSAKHSPGRKARTTKVGLDATIRWEREGARPSLEGFRRVSYEPVELDKYL